MAVALGAAACSASWRQVRPTEPIEAAAAGLRVDVQRVFLTDDTIENGVADGMGLVVELNVANRGVRPYRLSPTALWCLMQIDARKPEETRLLPPSENGDGPFPGAPPEGGDLQPIEVAPGQTRSFWILFRGYQFAGSELARRITLTLPDADGHGLELVLADPARGLLRWEVPPTRSAWTFGVQSGQLSGSYVQGMSISDRISRMSRAGRFLWDVGLVSSVFVQVQGALRSSSSSFSGLGFDAHLALPLATWGPPTSPIRLGPYLGGEIQVLVALQPKSNQSPPPPVPIYGEGGPEAGLELDVGGLRNALTPFPLSPAGRNPLPRWLIRVGYTHDWIGHGTADGYVSCFRMIW
ncbi:MAG TPA: hypothetical protein VH853_07440 [Polyangia bacterium]|nr:hypothetical protein [Polyangia bacterium]